MLWGMQLTELSNMTDAELNQLADNLKRIALFVGKRELRKIFIQKIAKIDSRISALERRFVYTRKSIVGQDENPEQAALWPSLIKQL